MTSLLPLLPLLAPLALLCVVAHSRLRPGTNTRGLRRTAGLASAAGLLIAAGTAVLVALEGATSTGVLGVGGLGLALRLDALSSAMFCLVAFLGAVVMRFSGRYLEGDPRHGAFLGRMALTVASVMLLVLSGNLVQLVLTWATTSFALHGLLLFYAERPLARVAARKKFIVARLGDLCLAIAAWLVWSELGTADLALVGARAAELAVEGGLPSALQVAALLIVASAALKSAQFPTHGWLAEVMETPTPVSALLHAGILNGGTFLAARLSGLVAESPAALDALVLIGGATALLASLVMVTQTTAKGALAYSSAAHMGFMLFMCGIGAWGVAIVHLIAHSCYKAHAFLAAGSAVEVVRANARAGQARAGVGTVLAAMLVAGVTVIGVASLVGVSVIHDTVTFGLAAVLAIGLAQLLGQGLAGNPGARVIASASAAAAAVALSFFVLELVAARILAGVVPIGIEPASHTLVLAALVIAAFAVAVSGQLLLPRYAHTPWARALWVHISNGLYANARFDSWVGAWRVDRRA